MKNTILYVVGGVMNRAGAETFIMNYYRHMDRSKVQADFIVHGYGEGAYDKEIEKLGGRIYNVPAKRENLIKNVQMIRKICKSGKYKVIHAHMDATSYIPLEIAKRCGVPVRIAHSHCTAHTVNGGIHMLLNGYAQKRLPSVATHYFACSEKAGIWLFGKKNCERIQIIPNAIDTDKFKYDKKMRNSIRKQIGFSDADIIIGHVGRFEYQKNHEYLIEIFNKLYAKSGRYRLMMIGDGSLKKLIMEKVKNYALDNAVTFIDACDNVFEFYNAFDLVCMPSHFEGLSVVMVEAQCNGLHCITSDTTSTESNVTGNVKFLPISSDAIDIWVDYILRSDCSRDTDAIRKIIDRGYSIYDTAVRLQEKYLQLISECH